MSNYLPSGYHPRSTLAAQARRFAAYALRCGGSGSVRASLGAVWRAYLRWCRLIEGNRPFPPDLFLPALERELAAHTDGVVVLAGSGLWPDTLGAAA